MKKTIAIILALLMMLSVAFVSCSEKEPKDTDDTTDDFWDNVGETDDKKSSETGDETDKNGNNVTTNSTFVTVNDTVYVLYNAVIRETAKTSGKQVATAVFGTQLPRVEKNSKWSKVKVGDVEGYIANDLITTNSGTVTFTKLETPATAKVVNLGESKNANLRKYPIALTSPAVVDIKEFNAHCIIGQIAKDTEVTVISVSGDGQWAYVKCQAKASKGEGEFEDTTKELEGYCSLGALDYNKNGGSDSSDGDFFG